MTAPRTRASMLAVAVSAFFIGGAPAAAVAQGDAGAHTATMRNAARAIGEEALAAFDARDYETALAKFDQAEALVPVPTLGVRAARCLVELGRWNEAVERYLRTERMTIDPTLSDANRAAQADAQREAAAERTALEPRIPALSITVEGPPPDALWLDDAPLPADVLGKPRRVDPGRHVVRASRGGVKVEQRVELAEAAVVEIALRWPRAPSGPTALSTRPDPVAPSTPSSGEVQRVVGWVVGGAGVSSLAVGLVTLAVALDLQSDLDELCADQTCLESVAGPEIADDVATYNTVATTSIATLIAGGVLTGAGAVLVLTAPSDQTATTRWRPGFVAGPDPRGGTLGVATLRATFE